MELSELIESIDILEYISQYTDFTEKNGEFWALSPFKDEKTPSFSVRQENNTFFDFSSGIGGNVLTFVRYYDKCGYKEAIEKLKKYSGVNGNIVSHGRLATTEVAKRFAPPKRTVKQVKTTILPDDYMERYEKNKEKLKIWLDEGISMTSLEKFNVRYDGFSNCLVYPIRNPDGKIVNVGGRTLDPDWKEKKIRKYTYFHSWGELRTLYGLAENREQIEKAREIILFEGCKSVLLADTYGIHNTGALLTSHLNPNQMKILIELGCRVVFALDKDVVIRNDYNIKRLTRVVSEEAGCDWMPDWVPEAVASVILNRVASSKFPNDIKSVIRQPDQYGPYITGSMWMREPTARVKRIVKETLNKGSVLPAGVLGQSGYPTGAVHKSYYDYVLGTTIYFFYV